MFIETREGDIVNLAHVAHAETGKIQNPRLEGLRYVYCCFHMADGSVIRGHVHEKFSYEEGFNRFTAQSIPAEPGYHALEIWFDDDEEVVEQHPIVAWCISDGDAVPVTPFGIEKDPAVLYPDGRVVEPYDLTCRNIEAWKRHRREMHDRFGEKKTAQKK